MAWVIKKWGGLGWLRLEMKKVYEWSWIWVNDSDFEIIAGVFGVGGGRTVQFFLLFTAIEDWVDGGGATQNKI